MLTLQQLVQVSYPKANTAKTILVLFNTAPRKEESWQSTEWCKRLVLCQSEFMLFLGKENPTWPLCGISVISETSNPSYNVTKEGMARAKLFHTFMLSLLFLFRLVLGENRTGKADHI